MTTRTRLNAELATRRYTRRHAREIVTAMLGNNAGTVVATTDTRWYWIRLHADPNQVVRAWNTGFVPPIPDLPVDVEIVKANGITDYQIIGVSLNRGVVADVNAGATGSHALQHERGDFNTGGFDPLNVYNRAIVQLRARAQATPDLTLHVEAGFYPVAGISTYFPGGDSPTFVAPAAGSQCNLLYLGNDGVLRILAGTTVLVGTPSRPLQLSADDVPIAYVYLTAGMTTVTENEIEDGRMLFGTSGVWTPLTSAIWEQELNNAPGCHIMCFANLGSNVFLAGGDDNTPSGTGNAIIRKSTDGGVTWGAATVINAADLVLSLCNVGGGIVLLGTDTASRIYRSTDNGANWTFITSLDTNGVYSIVKLPDGSIVAGTYPNGKIFRSTDNGLTWSLRLTAWPASNSKSIYSMVDCGGGVVIAGGGAAAPNSGYIYKSTDYGVSWTRKSLLDDYAVLSVAYDGINVYAGTTTTAKIYRSTDLGETWDAGTTLDSFPIWSMTTLDTGDIIAGTMDDWNLGSVNGGNVYRSVNHGASWTLWENFIGYVNGLIDTGAGHPLAGISGWYTTPSSIWKYVAGSGSVPTGTGFRHITGGIEDGAAQLVVNADVDAAAAIVESKLALNFATHAQDHHARHEPGGADAMAVDAAAATGSLRTLGTGAAQAAAGDHAHAGGGGGHLHGLDRWVADGGATFNLLDFAEYVDWVTDNGSSVDPLTITLSADSSQIVFDSAPTSGHILTAGYVIAGA